MNSFDSYLEMPLSLPFQEMQSLHNELIFEIGSDPDALELYDELLDISTKYSNIRAEWVRMSFDEKMDRDASRTACHDSVITHFNMLSRYLRANGKKAAWRDRLGYIEDDPYTRKTVGDFACFIVFVNSICAR